MSGKMHTSQCLLLLYVGWAAGKLVRRLQNALSLKFSDARTVICIDNTT